MDDERFSHVAWDPKFRRMPKKDRKVTVDKRFNSMFTDPKFKLKYKVDKRGRPLQKTSAEDLRNYYELSDNDEEGKQSSSEASDNDSNQIAEENEKNKKRIRSKPQLEAEEDDTDSENDEEEENDGEEEEEEEEKNVQRKSQSKLKSKSKAEESDTESEEEEEDEDEENNMKIKLDLARGDGNFASSSSEDSSSEWELEEGEDGATDHAWGELDKERPRVENPTRRLAVCNMDWDRIRAQDLLVLFNSFKSPSGVVECVRIYPSEFGRKQLAEEEIHGPVAVLDADPDDPEDPDDDRGKQGDDENPKVRERIRSYQLQRLKYYYAIVECDSAETANSIYDACNGVEYESSANRLDLSFVPDAMTFDESSVHDEAKGIEELTKYQPRIYTTAALQQSNVALTWDETDPERTKLTRKAFDKDTLDKLDLKQIVASGSESDEEEEDTKARDLLMGFIKEESGKRNGSQREDKMEISWEPGLISSEAANIEEDVSRQHPNRSSWEEYLEKRKEKKKKHKQDIKMKKQESRRMRNGEKPEQHESESESDAQDPSLDLLLTEEKSNKHHFRLKKLLDEQKRIEKEDRKTKGKRKNKEEEQGDEFRVNVADERFAALYSNHLYNIDPSDPNFKKTKAMEEIVTEKQKRAQKRNLSIPEKTPTLNIQTTKSSWTTMAETLKTKTTKWNEKKKRKMK